MKQNILTYLALGSLIALAACSKSTPKCSDSEATDTVKKIALKQLAKGIPDDALKEFSFKVDSIRTESTNKETGAHQCAGELKINHKGDSDEKSLPITYTVEKTDDGKDIYVNVRGL